MACSGNVNCASARWNRVGCGVKARRRNRPDIAVPSHRVVDGPRDGLTGIAWPLHAGITLISSVDLNACGRAGHGYQRNRGLRASGAPVASASAPTVASSQQGAQNSDCGQSGRTPRKSSETQIPHQDIQGRLQFFRSRSFGFPELVVTPASYYRVKRCRLSAGKNLLVLSRT